MKNHFPPASFVYIRFNQVIHHFTLEYINGEQSLPLELAFRVKLGFSYDDKHPPFIVQVSSPINSKIGRDKKERKKK